MRSTTLSLLWLLGTAIICGLASRPAEADLWTAGSGSSDGPLSAEADFTITPGQIKVTITDLLSPTAVKSAGQAVSDLTFTISNAPGTDSSNTAAGSLVDVGACGSVTAVGGTPGRWVGLEAGLGAFGITGSTITLETIGGGKPTEMILPSDNGGGYPSANASITQNFSPWTDGPATFTINLTGVTSSTTITGATFSFGTGPDHYVPGVDATPEPASVLVWGLMGLTGAVYARYRKVFGRVRGDSLQSTGVGPTNRLYSQ